MAFYRAMSKFTRLRLLSALLLTALMLACANCESGRKEEGTASHPQFGAIENAAQNKHDSEVLRMGADKVAKGDTNGALMCYAIVSGHYLPSLDNAGKSLCVEAFKRSGSIYQYQTNFIEALDMYLKALEISESIPDKPGIMELYMRIGLVYCNLDDLDTGLMFLRDGYNLHKRYPDATCETNLLFDLTAYSALAGDTDSAWKYYELARKRDFASNPALRFRIVYNKGMILSSEKKYEAAVEEYRKAISLTDSPRYKAYTYERLYNDFRNLGQRDSTLHYMRLVGAEAQRLDIAGLYLIVLKDLSDFYAGTDQQLSLSYKNRYLAMADSCYNRQQFDRLKTRQLTRVIDNERDRIGRLEVERAERETKMRGQIRFIVVIALCLAVAVALLVVVIRKKKSLDASYRNIYQQNLRVLAAEQAGKEKCRQYEEEIERIRQELDRKAEPAEAHAPKYGQSRLKDTQKDVLIAGINSLAASGTMLEPDFTLAKMAKLLESNSQYVSQVLNESYGKSFTDLINEYRVKEACRRIADTANYGNYSIDGIGQSVGFGSTSTFLRAFRKITGLTPSVYRKMAMSEQEDDAESAVNDCH